MDIFFKYIDYAEKIQKKELKLIPISDTRKIEEYLNSVQKNSKRKNNRLKVQHIHDAIETVSKEENNSASNLKCVVSAVSAYESNNYIWAHLAFISKSNIKDNDQWHLYGYIRAYFRHVHIPGKFGVTSYGSDTPENKVLFKEIQQKTVHERLKALTAKLNQPFTVPQ